MVAYSMANVTALWNAQKGLCRHLSTCVRNEMMRPHYFSSHSTGFTAVLLTSQSLLPLWRLEFTHFHWWYSESDIDRYWYHLYWLDLIWKLFFLAEKHNLLKKCGCELTQLQLAICLFSEMFIGSSGLIEPAPTPIKSILKERASGLQTPQFTPRLYFHATNQFKRSTFTLG